MAVLGSIASLQSIVGVVSRVVDPLQEIEEWVLQEGLYQVAAVLYSQKLNTAISRVQQRKQYR